MAANDGNRNQMAEDEFLDIIQEILATPRGSVSPSLHPSNSLPVMPSHIQPPPAIEPPRIRPHVVIIEEPTNRTIRFRYQCENRTAASIPGMNSTPENRTFPTIEIVGYEGSVLVIISCVTSKPPYHQHPHVLISREDEDNCRHGVYSKKLKPGERRLELQKVGIQCVRRRDVKTSLLARQARNIDPFNAGFDHMNDTGSINLYELRLCFQVFLTGNGQATPLEPVVSSPIYGKSNELTITRLCSCSSPMSGGAKIIMLCDKISKSDIKIRFFETNDDGNEDWEAFADFQPSDIHKQCAIPFTVPRYRNSDCQQHVKVEVQLLRPSDGATSAPLEFEYYPNPELLAKKRRRISESMKQIHSQPSNVEPTSMEDNKHFEQIMKSWLSNNTQARQSPSGMSDIKYELEKPRNCPSTSSATTYGYPYSPSDNSVSTADGYAPVNVFAQQQQQQGPNGLQYNLPPLDMNPCCSKYAKRQNQTNVTIDFSPGGTTTLQTQPDDLKKMLHQLQQPQQQQQQPNLLSPHDQLLKLTQGLSITNGVSSNTYGNLVNGGDGVHINTNNNLDALTINHQTINTINNNMFINGGTSPAYSQQPAYSPGSIQSPSPVQFQQQQFQPDQQFQLQNPMMNMINHNQLSPNMNVGITPAYQQSNFLPVPMHSPSPGQQQYQEQLHYNQQQQQQQQPQQQQQQLQYQQVEPFEQSENPNISDLIETMDGVLVKDLIARNQNAGN